MVYSANLPVLPNVNPAALAFLVDDLIATQEESENTVVMLQGLVGGEEPSPLLLIFSYTIDWIV